MHRRCLFLLFFLLGALPCQLLAADTLSFYSAQVAINIPPPMPQMSIDRVDEQQLVQWYLKHQETAYYAPLLQEAQAEKGRLALNDWLYYELLRKIAQQIFPAPTLSQRLLCWFLLSESGYDTRLTFLEKQIFLYAYTEESLFDTPMIMDNGRRYVNLSSIHEPMSNPAVSLSLLHYDTNSSGRSFSFQLPGWPLLTPQIEQRQMSFQWRGQELVLDLEVDRTIAEVMENYPIFEEYQYLEVPLSPTLSRSLLPQLEALLKEKGEQEALECLVAFTRSAFRYKEDRDHFGRNKPMVADELFHYSYSDCEDRSALFFNLVRQLLELPMIAIAYPDHLTIAVALQQNIGPSIQYEGQRYYICDPTGPSNSAKIGQIPEGYEDISFEILGNHK